MVTPPPTRVGDAPATDVHPLVLAACKLVGVRHVFRIGGAQAMAALAFGTESVPAVDMIVGPGNTYVQLAKAQLAGVTGTDGFYGPSEIHHCDASPTRRSRRTARAGRADPARFMVAWEARC